MCGIVGVVAQSINKLQADKFKQLLEVGVLRGRDSTGLFGLSRNKGVVRYKEALPSGWLVDDKDYLSSLHRCDKMIVGHNRAGTFGGVGREQAHPFSRGAITLVHNGTLLDTTNLRGHSLMDVDSEMIANELALVEPSEWKDVLEKLDGAYALVWWDDRISRLRMARNHERPLCIASVPNGMYFASEEGMLRWILNRGTSVKKAEYDPLPAGVMMEVDVYKFGVTEHEFTPLPYTHIWGGYSYKNNNKSKEPVKNLPVNYHNNTKLAGCPAKGTTLTFEVDEIKTTNLGQVYRSAMEDGVIITAYSRDNTIKVGDLMEGSFDFVIRLPKKGEDEYRLVGATKVQDSDEQRCAWCESLMTTKELGESVPDKILINRVVHKDCAEFAEAYCYGS